MRWSTVTVSAAALVASVSAQDDLETFEYCDELERCFTAYTVEDAEITFGIATPETDDEKFDIIFQATAPIESTGWVGLAWGGGMTYNPLAIMWLNGEDIMLSSRMAFGYFAPPVYEDTTYSLLPGTSVNETHWTVTALCKGCSYWAPFGADPTMLNPSGENYLAFAYSSVPVDEPDNYETTFGIHERVGHWIHDLGAAQTPDFADWAAEAEAPEEGAPEAPEDGESPVDGPTTTTTSTMLTSSTTPEPSASETEAEGGEEEDAPEALPLPSSCPGVAAPRFPLATAEGWKVVKLSQGLTRPRGMVVDKMGNLLVIENGKGLTVQTFGPDGCISSSKTVIDNGLLNHGIGLAPDGETLYVSSMTTAWKYKYDAETQSVDDGVVVVKGMYSGGHPTRAIVIPPATPNLLVMQLGSNANFDMESLMPETARAIVKVFDMDTVPEGGWNYITEGWNLGYGLRNEVALVVDGNNMVWGIENSGDNLGRTADGRTVDVHIDNPAEELNLLGDPSKPNDNWYGYPVCFTIGEPAVFADKTFSVGDQFVIAPNATYDDTNCDADSTPPRLSIQAHSAPIDGKFDKAFENMYVTLHGSWNRAPPTGYKVIKIPYHQTEDGAYDPVAAPDSQYGYEDVLWSEGIERCSGTACIRPSGIVWDNAFTRMFVASDNTVAGELFMLYQE